MPPPINFTSGPGVNDPAYAAMFTSPGAAPPAPPLVFPPGPTNTAIGAQFARAAGGNPFVANPSASGISRFLRPGMTARGAAFRAAGPAFLGNMASGAIDQLNPGGQNSNWEQGLQGAALGAGVGAGVGSVVPGLGTGIGALVGGGIGAAGGVITNALGLGGDSGPSPEDIANQLTSSISPQARAELYQVAGIDAQTRAQLDRAIDTQLALLAQQNDLSDEDKIAGIAGIVQQFQGAIQSYAAQPPMETPNELSPRDMAALQMAIANFTQPYADETRQAGVQGAGALRALGAGPQADLMQSSANRMAAAYSMQAQTIPMMAQLQQQQSAWAQFAQQQQAQQMAGGGGGQGSFDQYLAQLGAAGG